MMPLRLKVGFGLLALLLVLGVVLPPFAPDDPTVWQQSPPNLPPSAWHWFGTTALGQDGFWLLTWGTRNSLALGVMVAAAATLIGVSAGLCAGFTGGIADRVLAFLMDVFICIPSLPILIQFAAILKGDASLPVIAIILIVFNWPYPARQTRAVAISMREREFIHVARFSGESLPRILLHQIFPYLRSWSLGNFVNTVLVAVAAESSLAVIGLSSADQPSLGTMIYWALQHQALLAGRWLWIGPPVVTIVALFIALFLTSSGITQAAAARRGR
jgi:peptide/nickel transport system permease protein